MQCHNYGDKKMTKLPCIKCEPLFSDTTVNHHKKILKYQRDWFALKIENNDLKDQITELKELLKMHNDAKNILGVTK